MVESFDLVILRDKETGKCMLGVGAGRGVLPLVMFSGLDGVKKLRSTLDDFISEAEEKIPPIFLEAFEDNGSI